MWSYGSATLPEVLWTAGALLGLLVAQWALVDATADLHYLEAQGVNGVRERMARGSVVEEVIRLVIQAVFLVIGAAAMLTAPIDPDAPVTTLGVLIAAGLIVAEALLVFKSLYARRVRREVVQLLLERSRP